MDLYPILSSVMTVVTFASFLGIVAWAYSRRRRSAFDEAARAPFALPDEGEQAATDPAGKGATR